MKKFNAGDPLKIPAADYNLMVDAAEAHRDSKHDVRAKAFDTGTYESTVVSVRNDTGTYVPRYGVLALYGTVIDPTANYNGFLNGQVVLKGDIPVEKWDLGFFGITIEPLMPGKIGKCIISGLAHCMINVRVESDPFADVIDGDVNYLQSCSDIGSSTILWKQSGLGHKWALIKIGRLDTGLRIGKITKGLGSDARFRGRFYRLDGLLYSENFDVLCDVADLEHVEVGRDYAAVFRNNMWYCTAIYEPTMYYSSDYGWSSEFMSSQDMSSGFMSSHNYSSQEWESSGLLSSGDWGSSGFMSSGDFSSGMLSSGDISSGELLSSGKGWSSGFMSSEDWSSGFMSSGDYSSDEGWSSGFMSSGDWSSGFMSSGDYIWSSAYPSSGEILSSGEPSSDAFSSGYPSSEAFSSEHPSSEGPSSNEPSSQAVSSGDWYDCNVTGFAVEFVGVENVGTSNCPYDPSMQANMINGIWSLSQTGGSGSCTYEATTPQGHAILVVLDDNGGYIKVLDSNNDDESVFDFSGEPVGRGHTYPNNNMITGNLKCRGKNGMCRIF